LMPEVAPLELAWILNSCVCPDVKTSFVQEFNNRLSKSPADKMHNFFIAVVFDG
jgi:hypothetical protein